MPDTKPIHMKKIYLKITIAITALVLGFGSLSAQCLGGFNYGSASLNGIQQNYTMIAGCMFFSERNTLNVSYLAGAYSFSVTNATYITIYDSGNNVVAQGNSPLVNVTFTANGTYYLRPTLSGPPNCTQGGGCIDSYWKCDLPCTGTPVTGTITSAPALVCPGSSGTITLPGSTIAGGLNYLWFWSTNSALGPFTAVPTATDPVFYTSPSNTASTWYYAVITCTNSMASATSAVIQVDLDGVTVDNVPYFESFEGITYNNMLPNCSWMATNLGFETETYTVSGSDNRMPKSGDHFASFYYWPGGTNSFFTNGIQMYANVTYTASLWYTTNIWGDDNWEDLSIFVTDDQNVSGQTLIATTPGPAVSPQHKGLGNTFTVPQDGIYYIEVQATSNTNAFAPWLTWDDLRIEVPCSLNQPSVTVMAPASTVCVGDLVAIIADGAHLYDWNTGDQTPSVNFTASQPGTHPYTVKGTNTITGCSTTLTQNITVNPLPFVGAMSNKSSVCPGESVNVTAVGNAASYIWSPTGQGNILTHQPTGTTIYSVTGTSADNCSSTATVGVVVHSQPAVSAMASHTNVCVGEIVEFTGDGASQYSWSSSNAFVQSNPAQVLQSTEGTFVYTVTGTDANGCTDTDEIFLLVGKCTGLTEEGSAAISVYPNPGTGVYLVRTPAAGSQVNVFDITGRRVHSMTTGASAGTIDISNLSSGMYYFHVQAGSRTEVVRVIKN